MVTSPVEVPNCDAIALARGALLRPAKIAIGLSTALSEARVEYKKKDGSGEIHPFRSEELPGEDSNPH